MASTPLRLLLSLLVFQAPQESLSLLQSPRLLQLFLLPFLLWLLLLLQPLRLLHLQGILLLPQFSLLSLLQSLWSLRVRVWLLALFLLCPYLCSSPVPPLRVCSNSSSGLRYDPCWNGLLSFSFLRQSALFGCGFVSCHLFSAS